MKTLKLSDKTYAQVQRLLRESGNSALNKTLREALAQMPTELPTKFKIDTEAFDITGTPTELVGLANKLGKAMLTAPVVYRAISMPSQKAALENIRQDCRGSWVVLDDGVFYKPNNLSGKVVHNYGSSVVKPVEIYS